jgi:hypothetical protein
LITGKKHSCRNAVRHGLLSEKLLFSDDGQPITAELRQLWEDLHEKYDDGDARTNLLLDGLVIEHWRPCQRQSPTLVRKGPRPGCNRYRMDGQRALLKKHRGKIFAN